MIGSEILAKKVTITVNGTPREAAPGASLSEFLSSLQIDPRMVVVEHNRVILHDRENFKNIPLNAGDTIEIVHFVGGG
jgi:thiamine biosynthesis protein ThiS